MTDPSDKPPVWEIRLTVRARRDVLSAWQYQESFTGAELADAWLEGLEIAIAGLAQMPGRCPIAPEATLFSKPPVRQFVYRRTIKGPAYRILFRMSENTLYRRLVQIIAVRHGAQAQLTIEEAEAIDDSD